MTVIGERGRTSDWLCGASARLARALVELFSLQQQHLSTVATSPPAVIMHVYGTRGETSHKLGNGNMRTCADFCMRNMQAAHFKNSGMSKIHTDEACDSHHELMRRVAVELLSSLQRDSISKRYTLRSICADFCFMSM
jgi:hypothetical protein